MVPNKLTGKDLLDLYAGLGSAKLIREHMLDNANDGEKVPSAGTIRRRLREADPNYITTRSSNSDRVHASATGSPKQDTRPIAGGYVSAPDKTRKSLTGSRFVFTAAQNNTTVHKGFYDSLMRFCEDKDAQLVVSTFTYNKSGFQNGTKDNDELWYDPLIKDYIDNESSNVASDLVFCGELDILPTAALPLSGIESYTRDSSGIVPHAKVQLISLPRMAGEHARFMYTTGAITLRNYIQRKAGQKAEFHHVFGALYVEIDEQGDWFARQLVASEDGSFQDLTTVYRPCGITKDVPVASITWGDIHLEKADDEVFNLAWGDGDSMLNTLKPPYQFIHDLTDFRARNHHNINDPFFLAQMHKDGSANVEKDLHRCGVFLDWISSSGCTAVVVESNHDQALMQWLKTADIRKDPENAEFFHMASAKLHHAINKGDKDFNVFKWAVTADGLFPSRSIFLKEDDSFVVAGIENGMHGHHGPNGARGNPKGFRSIGRKVNIGHMHSACIIDGVYVAGVSGKLDMDYNKGPSSWSHSHIVTYASGKRAIVTMRNGKWKSKNLK